MKSQLSFHHVGYATKNISNEINFFLNMGYVLESDYFEDTLQGVRGCFMHGNGPRIELLENLPNHHTLDTWIENGIKMYHMAFLCDNLNSNIEIFIKSGSKVVCKPTPAAAFNGRKICFIMLKNFQLIELIEHYE